MLADRVAFEDRVPKEVRALFKRLPEAESIWEVFFREVVSRAVMDSFGATGINDKDEHEVEVGSAARWIKFGFQDEDLGYDTAEAFFDIADIDLAVVVRSLREHNREDTRYYARDN